MFKHYFEQIDNVAIWPVISFVIFFVFFLVLTWWALSADKKYITEMKEMPVDDIDANVKPNKAEKE